MARQILGAASATPYTTLVSPLHSGPFVMVSWVLLFPVFFLFGYVFNSLISLDVFCTLLPVHISRLCVASRLPPVSQSVLSFTCVPPPYATKSPCLPFPAFCHGLVLVASSVYIVSMSSSGPDFCLQVQGFNDSTISGLDTFRSLLSVFHTCSFHCICVLPTPSYDTMSHPKQSDLAVRPAASGSVGGQRERGVRRSSQILEVVSQQRL